MRYHWRAVTPFHFEYMFRARDPDAVFEVYFDPEHQAEQDRRVEVVKRETVEDVDGPETRRRTARVSPRRQLPAVLRPLIKGDLSYDESIVWHKTAHRIEFDIRPRILDGKAQILATYQLHPAGPGKVRRTYDGKATVEVRLIGGRIEKAIIEDLERSLTITAGCTQDYLDRRGLT
jgi:hypothetical protein